MVYGLIGKGISHSLSPRLFNGAFGIAGLDHEYRLFDIESIDKLPSIIKSEPALAGFNVTSPYKESILPYVDRLSSSARKVGAVNSVRIHRSLDGEILLEGHNTDVEGVVSLLEPFKLNGSAFILGTGGAAKSVAVALELLQVPFLTVSRFPGKGDLTYADLDREAVASAQLIVQATPAGMNDPKTAPPFPYPFLTPSHICVDLIYSPAVTLFMALASKGGATVRNGLQMLVSQAMAAWQFWNPDTPLSIKV